MKNKVKKKPTAKEMASAIIEINHRVIELHKIARQLDSIVGLYIEMKGDKKQFSAYVEDKYDDYVANKEKADDEKANGKADKDNIPANPKDARSGTEGIREESR